MSETRPLSDINDSTDSEPEQEDPYVARRMARVRPIQEARKKAPKCGICSKGFQLKKKLHIICGSCSSYFHKVSYDLGFVN